jgi:hypothetical protein
MSVVKIAKSTNLGLDLAWQHRLTSTSNDLSAKFKQFGNSYKVEGNGYEKNTLEAVFTLSQKISKSWETFVQASGEWGKNSKNHGAAIGVNVQI